MYLANKNIPEALILKIEYYPCFKPGVNASQGPNMQAQPTETSQSTV